MSRSPRTRRTGAATAIGVVIGALTLAGCGAGQITQTDTTVSAVGGAQATVGDIAVRDAQFEYAPTPGASVYSRGGDAPLKMSIVNTGAEPDTLVSASSPVAGSVRVSGNTEIAGGRVLVVEGEPVATVATSTAATASGGPTAAPTSSTAPTSTAPAPDEESAGAHVVLAGVNQEIRPGLTYPVTLTFQKAGSVTVDVPVGNATTPRTTSASG